MLNLNNPTRWRFMSNMVTARGNCSSCYFEDHIYVTGGWNSGRLSSCEWFSVHHNMWIKIESMINARDEHGTVVCDGWSFSV
uniref:Kelch-like protein 5 n=1 Tax=Phallusia mammillata TaxID=59560 RepID=A0A6F9DFD3_9ASCI|nr:kelch-like protein 5 [Phallusia mammillata]